MSLLLADPGLDGPSALLEALKELCRLPWPLEQSEIRSLRIWCIVAKWYFKVLEDVDPASELAIEKFFCGPLLVRVPGAEYSGYAHTQFVTATQVIVVR